MVWGTHAKGPLHCPLQLSVSTSFVRIGQKVPEEIVFQTDADGRSQSVGEPEVSYGIQMLKGEQ